MPARSAREAQVSPVRAVTVLVQEAVPWERTPTLNNRATKRLIKLPDDIIMNGNERRLYREVLSENIERETAYESHYGLHKSVRDVLCPQTARKGSYATRLGRRVRHYQDMLHG